MYNVTMYNVTVTYILNYSNDFYETLEIYTCQYGDYNYLSLLRKNNFYFNLNLKIEKLTRENV